MMCLSEPAGFTDCCIPFIMCACRQTQERWIRLCFAKIFFVNLNPAQPVSQDEDFGAMYKSWRIEVL